MTDISDKFLLRPGTKLVVVSDSDDDEIEKEKQVYV